MGLAACSLDQAPAHCCRCHRSSIQFASKESRRTPLLRQAGPVGCRLETSKGFSANGKANVMSEPTKAPASRIGSEDLSLPSALRAPLLAHLNELRKAYRRRGWGGRVGFGTRPAVVVIDL